MIVHLVGMVNRKDMDSWCKALTWNRRDCVHNDGAGTHGTIILALVKCEMSYFGPFKTYRLKGDQFCFVFLSKQSCSDYKIILRLNGLHFENNTNARNITAFYVSF